MDHDAAQGAGRPRSGPGFSIARQSRPSLEPLFKAALDGAAAGLILLDEARRVRHVTPKAASLLGLPPDGHAGAPILRLLARSLWLDAAALQTLAAAFSADDLAQPRKVLLAVPHPTGARTVTLDVRAAGGAGFVASLTDVTQARENEHWLLDQAFIDPVTGLWNRQHFMLMLRDRMDGAGGLRHLGAAAGPQAFPVRGRDLGRGGRRFAAASGRPAPGGFPARGRQTGALRVR